MTVKRRISELIAAARAEQKAKDVAIVRRHADGYTRLSLRMALGLAADEIEGFPPYKALVESDPNRVRSESIL